MEDAEPSDDMDLAVNVVMAFLLLGGALLLREIVRLVDFGVRHLQYNMVSRPCACIGGRHDNMDDGLQQGKYSFSTPQHFTGSFLGRFLGVPEAAAGAEAAGAAAAGAAAAGAAAAAAAREGAAG